MGGVKDYKTSYAYYYGQFVGVLMVSKGLTAKDIIEQMERVVAEKEKHIPTIPRRFKNIACGRAWDVKEDDTIEASEREFVKHPDDRPSTIFGAGKI